MTDLPPGGYRIRAETSSRNGVTFIGIALIGFFVLLGIALALKHKFEYTFLIFTVPLLAFFAFAILRARRSLVLQNDGFWFSGLRTRTYSLTDFAGFRITSSAGRYGYIRNYKLEGRSGHHDVTLVSDGPTLSFNPNDIRALKVWLAERLPDLEARDRAEENRERREAETYGGHRLPALSTAKQIARTVNWVVPLSAVAGYVSFNWGLIHTPSGTRFVSVAGLFLLPATLAVKLWSPSSFQLGQNVGGGAPPSLNLALVLGALLPVALEWLLCQPLHWVAAVIPVGILSALLCFITFKFALGRRDRLPTTIGVVAVLLILYSLGAVLVINAAFDSRKPKLESALVLERSQSSGRGGPDYYWKVRFSDEGNFERKVRVSRRLYEMYNISPTSPVPVPFVIGPGALGIEWIRGPWV